LRDQGWLLADSLRTELLEIEGIASAELEGNEVAPQGVRVQLAAGADVESVGREVERVLANHGMRSHRAADQSAEQESGRGVVEAVRDTAASSQPGPPPPPGAAQGGGAGGDVLPMPGVAQHAEPGPSLLTEPVLAEPLPAEPVAAMELESVSVEEGRKGIAVRVRVGDVSVSRQVSTSPDGMDTAIVAALAELLGVEADLIAVQRGEAGEARIVTALLEVAGQGQKVGSAVVAAGEAFAVAQAIWRALRAPE